MMHVEALQWPNCIFAGRLRPNCHQLYELGNTQLSQQSTLLTVYYIDIYRQVYIYIYIYIFI